ncbi:MAG: winged helix-turn-helix domain-containing protein, partial [Novosphingobium sp.]
MGDASEYRIGALVLQPHRQLLDNGNRIALGSKALALLSVLAEARGVLVTKDELMDAVWPGITVEENAIQVHIAALRKVLGAAAAQLITVRGLGYRLDAMLSANAPSQPEASVPAASLPTRINGQPVLAVLPFDNLSSDPELTFFCDGVSEEILTRITRHSRVTAIGRTSSFQFRGASKPQAGMQLGASHVLDGSIQRSGGRIRVSAHLLDCTSQTSLWSQRYDRDLEDVFAVQDEISEAIVEALKLEFAGGETAAVDPALYDLYLRARERVTRPALMRRNVESLAQVVRKAEHFAPGRATLAYRRAELMMHAPYGERAALAAEIERDIAACEALDPGHPDVLAARWELLPPFGSFAEQEAMLNSNAFTNPDFVDFLTVRAYFLECVGRSHDAASQAARAARLDPLNPFAVGLHSQALWFAGRYDEARAAMEFVRDKWPDSHHCAAVLIQACVHQ